MVKIGDTVTFVPTAYSSEATNRTEAANERLERCKVKGRVTAVHRRHRWYRVTYKPLFECEQHECFKF